MRSIEINRSANFRSWQNYLLDELKNKSKSEFLGEDLIYENDSIRIWNITLLPGERLPFRKINANFNVVSLTNSMVISRCSSGKIDLHHIDKNESKFFALANKNLVCDLENIGEDILVFHVTEFKQNVIRYDKNPIFSLKR